MQHSPFVSLKQLSAACSTVQKELYAIGLWNYDTRLLQANVYWQRIPFLSMYDALGFFTHGASRWQKLLGLEEGNIYVPQWILTHGFWKNRGSLRDVLRHEYAHAVAHYYPEHILLDKGFRQAFGGYYFGKFMRKVMPEDFVSSYAATCPMEDFAETFMLYTRYKGAMPRRFANSQNITRKWSFIERLSYSIST